MPELEQDEDIIDLELRSIKSIFETGEIRNMYELRKLYPTRISKALSINYGRYMTKLAKPYLFSIEEIIRFSRLVGVDPYKILDIILPEANKIVSLAKSRSVKSQSKEKTVPTKKIKKQVAAKNSSNKKKPNSNN